MDDDAKVEAITDFIQDNYGMAAYAALGIFYRHVDDTYEIYMYPEKLYCKGEITFDKDCQIADAKGTVLANAALRDQTIRCEFYNEE